MVSIIITSWKEPNTIPKAISCASVSSYNGYNGDIEIIQISPDKETLDAGLKTANEVGIKNFIQIKDPAKGKPTALKLGLEKAKGEIIILTDGDVFFSKNAVSELIKPFENTKVGGVTGQPIAQNSKKTQMGYYGNLLASAADHKRRKTCPTYSPTSNYLENNENHYFAMSGYIMAIRKCNIDIPSDVLSDDAFISYWLVKNGYSIVYNPNAKVNVKYPENLNDYYKQKARSLGGYIQLSKYNALQGIKNQRKFTDELKYIWYPISYAKGLKELYWSILLYPIRLFTWMKIWFERKLTKKDFTSTWVRIESTK